MRRVGSIIAGLLLLLTPMAPALAHAELIGMSPAAGSTVTTAPTRVVLRFGETMQSLGCTVVVIDPERTQVQTDELLVKGSTITVGLNVLTLPGTYHVNYRVLSADGHVVTDSRAFTFAPAGTTSATTGANAPAADLDAAPLGSRWPLLAVTALIMLSAAAVLLVLRRRG